MATEQHYTTSNWVSITDEQSLRLLLDAWSFRPAALGGQVKAKIRNSKLRFIGPGPFAPCPVDMAEDDESLSLYVDRERFLELVTKYIEDDLVVQHFDHQKLRYPFGMNFYTVNSDSGAVTQVSSTNIVGHFTDGIEL